MSEIIHTKADNHLICLPIFFKSTDGLLQRIQTYCRCYAVAKYDLFKSLIDKDYVYGSQGFTRFYADFEDKNRDTILKKVSALKSIWDHRNVYLIEGEFTRCGVGNDLLDNTNSVKRVICPATNAFALYDEIVSYVSENVPKNQDTLILAVLGPTATVLAYDLCLKGYQTIDLGHVDIEYEWFLRGTTGKAPVPGKAVNERGGNNPKDPITTPEYERQIIRRIL